MTQIVPKCVNFRVMERTVRWSATVLWTFVITNMAVRILMVGTLNNIRFSQYELLFKILF